MELFPRGRAGFGRWEPETDAPCDAVDGEVFFLPVIRHSFMLIDIKEDNCLPLCCKKLASIRSPKTGIRPARYTLKGRENTANEGRCIFRKG